MALGDYFRRHVFFQNEQEERSYSAANGYTPRRVAVPHMDYYNENSLEAFYRLHDSYENTRSEYRRFRDAYSKLTGATGYSDCRDLAAMLPGGIGDIEGLFSQLDNFAYGISRPSNYYSLLRNARKETGEYERMLLGLAREAAEDPEIIRLEAGIGTSLPLEVWECHTAPADFFWTLRDLLRYESMSEFVEDNFTSYEYGMASERNDECAVEIYGPDARRITRNTADRMGCSDTQTRNYEFTFLPSIQQLRRMLPRELAPNMFSINARYPENRYARTLRNLLYHNNRTRMALKDYYFEIFRKPSALADG